MKPVPKDAKRVNPFEMMLDAHTGLANSWTTVKGTATTRTQTEEGMGKGQTLYEVTFQCPRCEETHKFTTTEPHSDKVTHFVDPGLNKVPCQCGVTGHPVRCHCDGTLVFRVNW